MRFRGTLPGVLALVFAGAAFSWGQEVPRIGALFASQVEVDRLALGTTSGQANFTVDDCNFVTIEIVATVALNTAVQTPSGETLNESTIETFGGQFTSIEFPSGGSGTIIIPRAAPGFHYTFTFPTFGPGSYAVQFAAEPSLSQEVAVLCAAPSYVE